MADDPKNPLLDFLRNPYVRLADPAGIIKKYDCRMDHLNCVDCIICYFHSTSEGQISHSAKRSFQWKLEKQISHSAK